MVAPGCLIFISFTKLCRKIIDLIRLKWSRKKKVPQAIEEIDEQRYAHIPLVEKNILFQSEPKIPEFIPTLNVFSSGNVRKRIISQEVNINDSYDLYKKNE